MNTPEPNRRRVLGGIATLALPAAAATDPHAAHRMAAPDAEALPAELAQPLLGLFQRVKESLARAGEALPSSEVDRIDAQMAAGQLAEAARAAVALLQTRVLLSASINAEARVSVKRGLLRPQLVQGGWRLFLVRISSPALVPGKLGASSTSALPLNGLHPPGATPAGSMGQQAVSTTRGDLALRWLDLDVHDLAPLDASLEALPLDFKIIRLYAADAGLRSATLALDIGPGTGDIGGRDRVNVTFQVLPARTVSLNIRHVDGRPVTASLAVTDSLGRVVPSQTRRRLPDLFFQRKVYRADGQTLSLPAGDYKVELQRGPEYLLKTSQRRVPETGDLRWTFQLERWIDPGARGWYSGDHHIHAAGCAHYEQPEQGVGPEVMAPQVQGEGLAIGAVLTWGPGFYHQKTFFTGGDASVSRPGHILHYDLEVSGFPSSHCGHLALLQMQTMDYPGSSRIEQRPSSNAPVLRWARSQGAITGYAHAGVGLWVGSTELPNTLMPPFNGIGANDYIVTLPEGLVDFIGVCNHPPAAEMTIWYHTMNVGLRSVIAGETDWPCFFEESMGMGRSYVKLDEALGYAAWCKGLQRGRSYVSEGRAHLLDFKVRSADGMAEPGGADLSLAAPQALAIEVDFAARLEPAVTPQTEAIRKLGPLDKPYWHLERARVGESRQVIVELIVNGQPVEARAVAADGRVQALRFAYTPLASCWLALRVMYAAHTNPVWATVAEAPVRVKKSAQWCRAAVDACWHQKLPRIRPAEREEEARLYDRARRFYERMLSEAQA
ncbi:CehA/McbA family metallohydrolase [Roseateles violae]|uniref:CehA/McbA family metallohydrolase n=1 Tax=Roseateles violae TaxID=3058042 RepID=A0ABT8DTQ4_9BURK|nr:CehA/McbA family metallohydrolase [Pelomonas sp. PFR6]MDN3921456.1 CehA/McbA family metallohydrolase [Pelomonas sp. PFR6]